MVAAPALSPPIHRVMSPEPASQVAATWVQTPDETVLVLEWLEPPTSTWSAPVAPSPICQPLPAVFEAITRAAALDGLTQASIVKSPPARRRSVLSGTVTSPPAVVTDRDAQPALTSTVASPGVPSSSPSVGVTTQVQRSPTSVSAQPSVSPVNAVDAPSSSHAKS